MAWVRFTGDFPWDPPARPRSTIVYKAGRCRSVTADCARAAVAAGKGVRVRAPARADREAVLAGDLVPPDLAD